ncbi:cell division protein YceG involved in septum cleavage [Scopulibacillus daqui]|uniref:Cell division protein YceG involved in septum cleavage n=1 Tax=Scopulibacillus daqui TaxID=1469162 RepID=A0ABS2Q2M8_9BACL|nr:endolytic transglycosylase MltG [Scopulibacillus daqui]MBM7646371.1 cell division protein YceG involved in septum cleavage [Scopulibacillus daqui]
MTKRGMRGFAAGMLVACGIIAFFYYQIFQPANGGKTNSSETLTSKNVHKFLLDHHLVAVDQKEYHHLQKSKPHKNNKVIYRTRLYITSGMSTEDIAGNLQEFKIIKNKKDFLKYLKEHNLEEKIQPGHYDLGNNMSLAEIVNKITT